MSKRFLVVDDSMVARKMIQMCIEGNVPNATIVQASSGDMALKISETEMFDVITMDVNMPGEDGIVTAEKIRTIHPETHIFIITANIQHIVKDRVAHFGFKYIEKPISEAKLMPIFENLS